MKHKTTDEMKHILKTISMLAVLALCSCSKDTGEIPVAVEINYAGISGTWQLTEWCGEQLTEGRYCYLVIERTPGEESGTRSLTIYQNMDSSKSRCIESYYTLSEDEKGNVYANGYYAFGGGYWSSPYLISSLDETRMTWIVDGDSSDISVYTRCDSVPEDIVAGTRSL